VRGDLDEAEEMHRKSLEIAERISSATLIKKATSSLESFDESTASDQRGDE